jgi:hypothetical protein
VPGRPCSPIADSAWPVYDEAGAAGWHRAPGYVRAECRAGVSVTYLLADAAARCRAPRPGAPAPRGARGCSGLPAPLSAGAHVPGWNLALRASCHWGSPGWWSQPPAPVRSAASCLPFSSRWRNRPGRISCRRRGRSRPTSPSWAALSSRCLGEGLPGAPGPGQGGFAGAARTACGLAGVCPGPGRRHDPRQCLGGSAQPGAAGADFTAPTRGPGLPDR